jgi:hypothetical protein
VQQNLNIVRKIALNTIKDYKNKTASKRPISKLMFDCLLEPENIRSICLLMKIDFRDWGLAFAAFLR